MFLKISDNEGGNREGFENMIRWTLILVNKLKKFYKFADNKQTIPRLKQITSNEVTRAQIVSDTEKRKYARVKIFILISYTCVDKDGEILGQNQGTALDISQGGLLLETVSVINTEYVLLTIIDLENKMLELEGKVVYCKKTGFGKYRAGISFQGSLEENIKFASKIVRTYHSHKHKN